MAAASAGLHESEDHLSDETIDAHRAIVSIIEEFEAVDWYGQRADATRDPDLAAVLVHNGNEEKEHAAMALEWLRRHDPVLDRHLRTYLFTDGSIIEEEHAADPPRQNGSGGAGSLGVGSLHPEALS